MADSLSFDGMVGLYDETRTFDEECFSSALDYIESRFPPSKYGSVFEPGIGSGRIAIPLAERGYGIVGVDISEKMLSLLSENLHDKSFTNRIAFQQADTTDLPFPDAEFDLAIVVHLFYFIPDWRKAVDEICRVVKPNGFIILMHTGTGAEIPDMNRRYKELCAGQGFVVNPQGVSGTEEVVTYIRETGRAVEYVRDRWQWTAQIPVSRALEYIQRRAYSFTNEVPDEVHKAVIKMLREESELRHVENVPNQIYLVIVENDA